MNTELTDEELMNFFLTSEFDDVFTPEEYKYLLHKFRFFYRLLSAKHQSLKHQTDSVTDEAKSLKDYISKLTDEKNLEIDTLKKANKEIVERKLSLKERITGRITIPKKNTSNEHKRI